MQQRVEPSQIVGKVVKDTFVHDNHFTMTFQGGGYLRITGDYGSSGAGLDYDEELDIQGQYRCLLVGEEEMAAWRIEQDRIREQERTKAQALRDLNVEQVKAETLALKEQNKFQEVSTLMTLMRKHPDAVKQYLEYPSVVPGTTDRHREIADTNLASSGKPAESSLRGTVG